MSPHTYVIYFLGAVTWSPIQGHPQSRWMEKKKKWSSAEVMTIIISSFI